MAQSKAEEIESLLDRLSDVNSSMSSQLTGGNDTHAHTVARHRDILAEFTQVMRPHASCNLQTLFDACHFLSV